MRSSTPPSLDDRDYQRFRALLREHYGLDYRTEKRAELAYRLHQALATSSFASLDDYYRALLAPDPNPEVERLISILTVNETYFFRNRRQFAALTQSILPELIAARASRGRRLRFWSAGCATGEEPYSLAVALSELIPDLESWNITILATDIDRQALCEARVGVYGTRAFREMDSALRDRYFRAHGEEDQRWVLDETIRRMVAFDYLNLTENSYPSPDTNTSAMDLILHRNVAIYLSADVTRQVAERLYQALVPGGWLVVGASELNQQIYRRFETRNFPGAVIYQRPHKPTTGAKARATASAPMATGLPPKPTIPKAAPAAAAPAPAARPPSSEPAPASDLYQQALALHRAGKLESARTTLQTAIGQDPTLAPAHVLLARILADQGRLAEAQSHCECAIQQDKVRPEAYFILAQVHDELDQPEEAIKALKRTLFLDRDYAPAHILLGALYRRRGQTRRARKALENAADALRRRPPETVVPETDGATAGQLLEIVEARLRQAETE